MKYSDKFIGVTDVTRARLHTKGAITIIGDKPKLAPIVINKGKKHYRIGKVQNK